MDKGSYSGYRDLKAYRMTYDLALEIQQVTKTFPKEENFALIDQIRRSSRSVPANIAEAWKKRRYNKLFISKIIDAAGEVGETEVWLDFAKDFGYLDEQKHHDLRSKYDEVSRMLYGMIDKADKFTK